MSLEISRPVSNPDLPIIKPIGEQLAAVASLVSWFQFDEQFMDVDGSGNIAKVRPRAGSNAGVLAAVASPQRPTVRRDWLGGGYAAGHFNNSELAAAAALLNLGAAFTVALLVRAPAPIPSTYPFAVTWRTGGSDQTAIGLDSSTGRFIAYVGGVSPGSLGYLDNQSHLIVLAVNGTTVKSMSDGVRNPDITITTGTVGGGPLRVGGIDGASAGMRPVMDIADLWLFQEDLFLSGGAATLQALQDYPTYVYA